MGDVRVPAGKCPWCRKPTGADDLPAEPVGNGGFRVQAIHRDRYAESQGYFSAVGCGNRVRIYIAPDGTAPDGWERNRSAGA